MKMTSPWIAKSIARMALPIAATLATTTLLVACDHRAETPADTLVTDVDHSAVKRQSIGNCWLYAAGSWAESLHKSATGEEVNLSESYWTWWHFYDQIVQNPFLDELQTGGWWWTSSNIIRDHGVVMEEDFLAADASDIISLAQADALTYLNEQLKEGGTLAEASDRTPEKVRAELDKAFGSDMAAAEQLAIPAGDFVVGTSGDRQVSLEDAIAGNGQTRWSRVSYPAVYGENTSVPILTVERRKGVLERVMRALNDKKPVVMILMIDFNAWDESTGEFNLATFQANGAGRQGGHMLVLEDYVVDNVPGIGTIGEGDVSDEMKELALLGDLRYLVTKNSWGTGVNEGYHKFNVDYLDAQLPWESGESVQYYTTLSGFVLPPGY